MPSRKTAGKSILRAVATARSTMGKSMTGAVAVMSLGVEDGPNNCVKFFMAMATFSKYMPPSIQSGSQSRRDSEEVKEEDSDDERPSGGVICTLSGML